MPSDWSWWSSTTSTYSYSTNVWSFIVDAADVFEEEPKKHLGFADYLDDKK